MVDIEFPEFCTSTFIRARKEHKCCECDITIQKGESYRAIKGKWDGSFYTYKQCLHCHQAMQARKEDTCFESLGESLMEDHPSYAKEYFALLKRGSSKDVYLDATQEYKDDGYIFDENNDPVCDEHGDHTRRECYCNNCKFSCFDEVCSSCGDELKNWKDQNER